MNITEDDEYNLTTAGSNYSLGVVYVSGTFGAASVIINHKDSNDVLTPLNDGDILTEGQYKIEHGKSAVLVIVVTNADETTDLNIEYKGMYS
jgi:hypothetical protein